MTKIQNDEIENIAMPKEEENVSTELEELKLQLEDLNDKLLRAIAESQNIKRIAEKEKSDILKYGISNFARDILSVRDNLKLALESCLPSSDISNALLDGIKLTMSEIDKVMTKNGVSFVEALGHQFDPNIHQAMLEIEDQDKEPGTVIQVMQDGFLIHGRLLRPALVVVSKKGI